MRMYPNLSGHTIYYVNYFCVDEPEVYMSLDKLAEEYPGVEVDGNDNIKWDLTERGTLEIIGRAFNAESLENDLQKVARDLNNIHGVYAHERLESEYESLKSILDAAAEVTS